MANSARRARWIVTAATVAFVFSICTARYANGTTARNNAAEGQQEETEAGGSATVAATAVETPTDRSASHVSKPNILLIMVDDLGKEWISCYGSESIKTPHIDALAETGLKLNNAYSMAQCTPSRVALLTGQYPYTSGWINHWDVPRWGVGYFDWTEYTTLARVMKRAGYVTAAAGKWQINDFRIEPQAMKKQGFDDWCMWTGFETGNPPSGKRYYDPYLNTPSGSKTYKGKFGPDVCADFLIRFMHQNRDKPMLLYYPMILTHFPAVAPPDEADARGTAERYAAMVRYTDKIVGRLVKGLDAAGIRDRTIVIFTTDNGSPGGVTGIRNGVKVRGAKGKTTEPGLCEPFLVNCPGRVPHGESDALTAFVDLLPTFAELGGVELSDAFQVDGKSIAGVLLGRDKEGPHQWICGMGHGPAKLTQQGVTPVKEFTPRAIRDKQYKVLIDDRRQITQLFDLKADPWECHNPIGQRVEHATVLKKFQAILDAMPERDPAPRYRPRADPSTSHVKDHLASKVAARQFPRGSRTNPRDLMHHPDEPDEPDISRSTHECVAPRGQSRAGV